MAWEQTFNQWKNSEHLDPQLKEQLTALEADPAMLEDAFYIPLEFGTAGMRGIL